MAPFLLQQGCLKANYMHPCCSNSSSFSKEIKIKKVSFNDHSKAYYEIHNDRNRTFDAK